MLNNNISQKNWGASTLIFLGVISVVGLVGYIIKIKFSSLGWPITLTMANVALLLIVRFLPLHFFVGIVAIEKYWEGLKSQKKSYLVPTSTGIATNDDLILNCCMKDLLTEEIEAKLKPNFLIKDSKVAIASFRHDILISIVFSLVAILVTALDAIDIPILDYSKTNWAKETIDVVTKFKKNAEVAATGALIVAQFLWLLRTPFLIDVRNKSYIAENIH